MTRTILVPSEALGGLRVLSALSPDQLKSVLQAFEATGAEDPTVICLRIAETTGIGDSEAVDLYRVVDYLSGQLADKRLFDPSAILPDLDLALAESGARPASDLFRSPPKDLLSLLNPASDWRVLRKKHELLGGIVNPIQSLRTVCDLRPVFDEPREHLRGAGITITLEFLVTNSEGHSQQIVVTADEQMLEKILGKITEAQRKVAQIRETYLKAGSK
jgi:hypothetical protein